MISLDDFNEVVVVDFEFFGNPGDTPTPLCYCAKEIHSGNVIKQWIQDEIPGEPLYATGDKTLFIAFYAPAEMSCYRVLKWSPPTNILDLFVEFRNKTNGKDLPFGSGLIGACIYHGIKDGDATLKDVMRERILQGPPFTDEERERILNYCMKDVDLTVDLYNKMKDGIYLPQALYRGKYTYSVAVMENYGIPIDMEIFNKFRENWDFIKTRMVETVDVNYGVYEGISFNFKKFEEFLIKNNIPWELTEKGRLRTDDDYMKVMSKMYPVLQPLRELKNTVSKLKLMNIQVGSDGRNRAMLSPYRSITGRNYPSNAKFIFGPAVWLRGLIKPTLGNSISYIDFEQQEIGIAAALSGDKNLQHSYTSGDPYMTFAIQAGAAPVGATKQTHPEIRETFKTFMLALNYGMHYKTFAEQANLPVVTAKGMFDKHMHIYRRYWRWIKERMDIAHLGGVMRTRCGWDFYTKGAKPRTLQNFPMQANGAEILRISINLCIENDIRVIAPVQDAILIESTTDDIDVDIQLASELMIEASKSVLFGFPLRVEAKTVHYPNRYSDKRGGMVWDTVMGIINQKEEASV